MGLLATTDRAAGGLARAATTLGQMALVALGVHLAADQLDNHLLAAFTAAVSWLDRFAAPQAMWAAAGLGLDPEALLAWRDLPLPVIAAGGALCVELAADVLLWGSFVLSARDPRLSWPGFRRALGARALAVPFALGGAVAAGSWSMAMAAEDLLPVSPFAPWAAAGLGLAAFLRFGLPCWGRSVAALEPPARPLEGLGGAAILLPIGLLAWAHGAPVWGWLP